MNDINIKDKIINLIDTFLYAGKVSLELREKGLTKETKSDNKYLYEKVTEDLKMESKAIIPSPKRNLKIESIKK